MRFDIVINSKIIINAPNKGETNRFALVMARSDRRIKHGIPPPAAALPPMTIYRFDLRKDFTADTATQDHQRDRRTIVIPSW
jgi:hypothetical protein